MMAEAEVKQKEMDLGGGFTADERAYFDSKGEKAIPQPTPVTGEAQPQAPAPAMAPEPGPPPKIEEPKPQEMVPQGALHEERKRRQEAEERVRQSELLNARMEERFRMFRDAMQPRQQAPQAAPDPDRDIFGAVKHQGMEIARQRQEIEGYKRQIQQEDQLRALKQWGADAEASYVRANPDYYQALGHLRQARARQLQVWGMSPSAVGEQLKHEENQLLARAAAERRNPAEMAHELAKLAGYSRAQPAAVQPGQPLPPSTVDLNRIEAGQKQSGSLSNTGGSVGTDISDAEITDLLKMNDKDFGAWIEKYPGRFRRLKGAAH